jgi:spoIIIJ-associated protein
MVSKNTTEKIEKEAQELIGELIKMLGVEAEAKISISAELIKVEIDGQDLGLLIGYRGENIESLQLLLGIILNRKLGGDAWRPVLVDVGGWRAAREESLRVLVEQQVARLSADRSSVELPPMPPAQRRAAHILVSEHEGLASESAGEEPNRFVVIKKVGRD